MFVGGLIGVTDVGKMELFSRYEKVIDVYLPKGEGEAHGFAFVRFMHAKEL